MIFILVPLPEEVLQTSRCAILLYEVVLQTALGTGMGMNVTAQVQSMAFWGCLFASADQTQVSTVFVAEHEQPG